MKEGVLFGQNYVGSGGLHQTWTFDGTSWSKADPKVVPPFPQSLLIVGAATMDNTIVLLATAQETGGAVAWPSPVEPTWTFDGTTWSQVIRSSAFPTFSQASFVTVNGQVLLVSTSQDTATPYTTNVWTYDGQGWPELSTTGAPDGRLGCAMGVLP